MQNENSTEKVQEWLDSKRIPPRLSAEECELLAQYQSLEKRLKARQIPVPVAFQYNAEKIFAASPKVFTRRIIAAVAAAAILFAIFYVAVPDSPDRVRPPAPEPPRQVSEPAGECLVADEFPVLVSAISHEFLVDWSEWRQRWNFSQLWHAPRMDPKTKWADPGNEIKEQCYGIVTEVNYFLEFYTASGPGPRDRNS